MRRPCPRGTRLRRGACRTRTVESPAGTRLVEGGRCLIVELERSPKGTVGTPPNCRRRTIQINPNIINPDILDNLRPPTRPPKNPNRITQ